MKETNNRKTTLQLNIENEDFQIFCEENLKDKEILLQVLSNKKRDLLKFFRLSSYPKVTINLFKNKENYHAFIKQQESNAFAINLCYERIPEDKVLLVLNLSILHSFVRSLYRFLCKNWDVLPLWIEEGLAQALSGEKIAFQKTDFAFRNFFLDRIVRRDKEIPSLFFTKNSKEEWASLDAMKMDPYDISYLLVHYLLETRTNFYEIITSKERIKELENTILEESILYYNGKYPVKENFQEIKNARELMDYMTKNILYGWIDKDKNATVESIKNSEKNSRTCSIQDILKIKVGTCADKAKLIKYWFDTVGIENKVFCCRAFTEENGREKILMHCFVLFAYQGYWYHFEQANTDKRGIYKYATLEKAIEQSANKFLKKYNVKELTEIPDIPSDLTYQELNAYISSFPEYSFKENRNR